MHPAARSRQGRGDVARSAVALGGLVLAACAGGNGTLPGRVPFAGGPDGGDHVVTVVAQHDGRVAARVKARAGGRFTLSVPPGSYQVALAGQVPGTIQRPGNATVRSGQTASVHLVCIYASGSNRKTAE